MPNNAGYYHVAYAVATGIYALYTAVLVSRWNRVRARHAEGDKK